MEILNYKYCLILSIIFSISLLIGCSKDENTIPEPEVSEVSDIIMPSLDIIYKPGQRITIQGKGFNNTSKITFQSIKTNDKVEALNLSISSIGATFDTPLVHEQQSVILTHENKNMILGVLIFEAKEVGQDEKVKISQFADFNWDGNKRGNVYYQIFVRSFADSDGDGIGDLKGITAKLDYLDKMGIAGVWLTPIHPADSYHGYDVIDYKGVNSQFGTIEDLENLIQTAHSKNIKVILDYVINHSSIKHPWFIEACKSTDNSFRDYYVFSKDPKNDIKQGLVPMYDKNEQNAYDAAQWYNVGAGTIDYKYHSHFWTGSFADLNYGSDASKAYLSPAFGAIIDGAKFWIDKGIDGFRLDAVKHIYHNELSDDNPTFLKLFYDAVNTYYKQTRSASEDIYVVGEVLSEYNNVAPYYKGLPAIFDFSSWWRMEYAINNSHAKWYPKDIIQYQNLYKSYRADYINATKLSNHDEDRTRSVLGGGQIGLERSKMAAAILLTSSGYPYLYYGEEIGMIGKKSNGDEGVREPMLWSYTATDKYRTTWQSPRYSTEASVDNVTKQESIINSIYNTYNFLISLRNNYPALATGTISLTSDFIDNESNKNFMTFYRELGNEKLFIIHNVSNSKSTYTLKHKIKKPIADLNYPTLLKINDNHYHIAMPAYSTIILEL